MMTYIMVQDLVSNIVKSHGTSCTKEIIPRIIIRNITKINSIMTDFLSAQVLFLIFNTSAIYNFLHKYYTNIKYLKLL